MKKIYIALQIIIVGAGCLYAEEARRRGQLPTPEAARYEEETHVQSQTSAPDTARYEMVQSNLSARSTFLLDKYTGAVFQLVDTEEPLRVWKKMPIVDPPQPPADMKVRYRIFTSGLNARLTFLYNIETGQTWKLEVGTTEETNTWAPIEKGDI